MKKRNQARSNLINKIAIVVEVIVIVLFYYYIWRNLYPERTFPYYLGRGKYILMGIYGMLVILLIHLCEGFRFGYLRMTELLFSQWIALVITNFITYFQLALIANIMINPKPILILMVGDLILSFMFVYGIDIYYQRHTAPSQMLMVYGNKNAVTLKLKMDTRGDKYNIKSLMSSDEPLEKILDEILRYDAVVICDVSSELRNDLLKFCYLNSIKTYVTPKISDVVLCGADGIHLFDTPLLMVNTDGLTVEQRFVKRTMDIVLSVVALIVLSPFMLIVAILIKLEDHGPVFYKQRRITRDGKEFDILKFRSMIVDAEKHGAQGAVDNDDRITKVGKVIRAIRMDELPQLINIIKGDMSIVGPRPERIENVQEYTEAIPEFGFRHKVKGGLTGYAQVYGKYNTTAYDKLKLDLMYIENYSIILDIKIILVTIKVLFKKESTEGFDKVITPDEILELVSGKDK